MADAGAGMIWSDGIQAVQQESGGLMSFNVIRQADAPGLLFDAMRGDPDATRLAQGLASLLGQIASAPRHKPVLCACCPRALRRTFAVIIAGPERPNARNSIGFGICERCATEPEDIRTKAIEALRRIWPDARPVTITHGRAAGAMH